MEETRETLIERRGRYGSFTENANISQELKKYIHDKNQWKSLSPTQQEAIDNICIKLSRILSTGSDIEYKDNWVDISGYAQLVVNELENIYEQKQPSEESTEEAQTVETTWRKSY